jgi:hypothetical protein
MGLVSISLSFEHILLLAEVALTLRLLAFPRCQIGFLLNSDCIFSRVHLFFSFLREAMFFELGFLLLSKDRKLESLLLGLRFLLLLKGLFYNRWLFFFSRRFSTREVGNFLLKNQTFHLLDRSSTRAHQP